MCVCILVYNGHLCGDVLFYLFWGRSVFWQTWHWSVYFVFFQVITTTWSKTHICKVLRILSGNPNPKSGEQHILVGTIVHPSLALLTILNMKIDASFCLIGLLCSSFVAINQATHRRTPWSPLGDAERPHVAMGNLLASRTLGCTNDHVRYNIPLKFMPRKDCNVRGVRSKHTYIFIFINPVGFLSWFVKIIWELSNGNCGLLRCCQMILLSIQDIPKSKNTDVT